MDHEFIKQSKKYKKDLYIVTEAVEAVEDAPFKECSQMGGNIFYTACVKMGLKGTRNIRKEFHIPKSCTLAFRAKKLKVGKESVGISYYSDDKLGTWVYNEPGEETLRTCIYEIPVMYSVESIHQEVEENCVQFSFLSANLRGVFLTGFVAVMRNKDLLQELVFQLEESLETSDQCKLKADEPELQDLVENLQDHSGVIIPELAKAVVYFLEALDELQEEQLMLLEESLEKKIVPKQLELIDIILGNILSNGEKKFTVDIQLLSEEEMLIMGAMIEMSGVTVQKTEAHLTGTGDPAALVPLFVVLYVLSLLTKQEDD
ncbi:gasdermin-A2-like [Anolis sagrei]|uniref:gasdermin-A2-like n=1 Tax=Anolis sagrei TaxID=38937 RepID=UPI0035224C9E